MSILNSVIKIFVGDKQQKDLKILQPIVEKVTAFNSSLSELTNDELRAKTAEFKKRIAERTNTFSDQIIALEKEAKEAEIDRQEAIFSEIDNLKNDAYEASEEVLNEIMPEAFAVVKEAALALLFGSFFIKSNFISIFYNRKYKSISQLRYKNIRNFRIVL